MKNRTAGNLLKKYMRWPFAFAAFSAAATAGVYFYGKYAVYILLGVTAVFFVSALILFLIFRNSLLNILINYALDTDEKQTELMREMDVPYAIIEKNGRILWNNDEYVRIAGEKRPVTEIFPEIDEAFLRSIGTEKEAHLVYKNRKYKVMIKKIEVEEDETFGIFLYDETQLVDLRQKYYEDSSVVGLAYVDNYEEVTSGIEEVERSLLGAMVDRKVSNYFTEVGGVVKKLEKDRYVFFIKNLYLDKLEENRFKILDDVKSVRTGNAIGVTISMGIGCGAEDFIDNYRYARTAIDMALARGGDQVVIKDRENIKYYGGKSQSIEKSTRVKARVKAEAFKELVSSKEKVVIMGHKLMDIDCLGSAIGIWRTAAELGKKAYIVINNPGRSINSVIEKFKTPDYPADMFVTKAEAKNLLNSETVLAVVDVNKPVITEAPELLELAEEIVVFDHHRQGTEIIKNSSLSYIEPYASSSCEMVSEVLQYIGEKVKIRPAEADAMLAGIAVDTYNFTNQTGVRTFEAAAFLRKNGADVTRVRKYFRDSIDEYMAKAEAVHNAEIFRESFAISDCRGDGLETPTVIGAQAANELLDIDGIKASIVLTEYDDKVYISARSIDEVNVQVMMEKLGGGGHRSIAGAQLKGASLSEAREQVKNAILEMIKKGDIK